MDLSSIISGHVLKDPMSICCSYCCVTYCFKTKWFSKLCYYIHGLCKSGIHTNTQWCWIISLSRCLAPEPGSLMIDLPQWRRLESPGDIFTHIFNSWYWLSSVTSYGAVNQSVYRWSLPAVWAFSWWPQSSWASYIMSQFSKNGPPFMI